MPGISDIILRICLSCILGGLVGLERESLNRPAGFRTHVLVCMGSTLVMLANLHIFYEFTNLTNLDPARLGAQVISGIGFLGAGTIIKEGSTVKGLTTAAGLWAVAGIGIAIGTGFYLGAIMTTFLVLVTLIIFSKVEKNFIKPMSNSTTIKLISFDRPGQIGKIGTELGKLNISITNITLSSVDEIYISIGLTLVVPRNLHKTFVIEKLLKIEGITSAEISS